MDTAGALHKQSQAEEKPSEESLSSAKAESSTFEELFSFTPSDLDLMTPVVYSMVTLLRLRGKQVSPQALMGGHVHHASPAACLRAAKQMGISGRILRRDDLTSFTASILPCILLLHNERSLVLLSVQADKARVILPEYGDVVHTLSLEELRHEYAGYALFASPAHERDARTERLQLLKAKRWFWDVIWHYWPIYKHVVIASVIVNTIGITGSLFAMNVYDRVVPNNATDTLWVLAVGISIAYVADFILRNLRSYFVDVAGRNADVILSSSLLHKVLTMRFDARPESTGALVNNLREFEALRDFFSSSTLLTLVDLPFLLIFLLIIGFLGGPLVLVPILSIPLLLGISFWTHWRIRRHAESAFKENMQKNAFLVETINGLETVRCCMAENRMQRTWEKLVGASALASSQNRRYSTIASTLSSTLSQFVSVAIIVWGVYLIGAGSMTMGALIGCNILLGRAMAPLMQLASMLTRVQQSRMALRALDILMETPSEDSEQQNTVDFGRLRHSISLENVSFSYPGTTRSSLNRVSLHISAGERVGIVGRMGSGKSTLGKLIVGLYDPEEGIVRFDDVDIQQMRKADLRSRIGFLPQDVVLFYGSIRDNIALDDPTVTDRLVLRAAGIATVSDFVRSLPAGFGEQVGERGMKLSGGQRQALALARALLHDPDMLILDEPTSNMDNATADTLRENLRKILPGKTLILISHRLSMLDLVDRLIVMENGAVLMDGPRDEILRRLHGTPLGPVGADRHAGKAAPPAPSVAVSTPSPAPDPVQITTPIPSPAPLKATALRVQAQAAPLTFSPTHPQGGERS